MNFKKYVKWLWLPVFWVVLYLLFAFVRMDFNAAQWSELLRAVFILFATLTSIPLGLTIHEI